MTVDYLKLKKQDEADLCSRSRAWLNDHHISTALMLLKKQHPHIFGLQTPTLQYTRTFDVQEGKEFVQVLNMSGNHWITISTIDCPCGVIKVYDSLHMGLPTWIKRTIADLMFFSGKSVAVQHMHMQHQSGGSDCGLFTPNLYHGNELITCN